MKSTNILSIITGLFLVMIVTSFSVPAEKPFALIALQVTVLDEKGNVVEGAEVLLYKNEDDAFDEVNAIKAKAKTNANGRVKFTKGLVEKTYFVVASKGKLMSEDGLESTKLKKNKVNKMNVIISANNHGMSVPSVSEGKKKN